jgi:transcriptional regulator with XRE-family HTH domain
MQSVNKLSFRTFVDSRRGEMAKKRPKHGRTVPVDEDRLLATMNHRGLSVEQLAGLAEVSVGTVNNLLAGKSVYRSTVRQLASALGISVAMLLGESVAGATAASVHEYLVSEVLTDWVTASNGLKFQICRLRHLELDRQARGKRFDLRDLSTDDEQRCRTWIKRHPNVCESLSQHPNIIHNITAFHDPVECFYWVIDEWVDGEPLRRRLNGKAFDHPSARQLMLDMAYGLQALHEQGIVRRELNPASVLIRQTDGRAILTEFELAKLIDRGPTVSTKDWPVDPYRAGEAAGDDVDQQADIYSWSRIAIHAMMGSLPEVGQEPAAMENVDLPSSVRDVVLSGAAVFRSDRPACLHNIIPIVEKWRAT